MARKLPGHLVYFLTLFTLKQGYLSCRNLLGLLVHPFKTITVLSRERDPIQILLIFGLPFYLWIGGLVAIIVGRILISAPFFYFGPLAVISLLLLSFISGLVFSYLTFWVFVFLKKRNGTI